MFQLGSRSTRRHTLRAAEVAACVGVLAAAATFVATPTIAAVVVGQSRTEAVSQSPTASIDQLKNKYRRPGSIPFPKDDLYTPEKAALGKMLFFDTRLSGANLLSCASCHNPAYGWGDGQAKGVGHGMNILGRRSPTVVNAAYSEIFMWDGRAGSLEEQALGPIQASVEMNLPLDRLLDRLRKIGEYKQLFQAVFPNEGIATISIAKAIATYERTVVSGRAPFDAWIEGDENAISESAKRGFVLFNTTARCAACHVGWNFTDDGFYDIGLPDADNGRGKFFPDVVKMQHAFKAPGLREITRRGPYMHDGSIPTLEAVIEHYEQGGVERPSRSDNIKPLSLTSQEKADLVSFMKTLSGDVDATTVPVLPR